MAPQSRLAKILIVAGDLLIDFDSYFRDPPNYLQYSSLNQKQIKRSKKTLIKKGLLEEDFELRKDDAESLSLINQPWDKLWRLVAFDIPKERKAVREKLRRQIYKLGFRLFQRSVWISPLAIDQKLKNLIKETAASKNLSLFIGRIFEENSKLLAQRLWQTEKWANMAQQLVKVFYKKGNSQDWQRRFWDLTYEHPRLPLDLLPRSWPLKKLVKVFLKSTTSK